MADETVLPYPNLRLPEQHFILLTPSLSRLHASARDTLLAGIRTDAMAPYLKAVIASGACPADDALVAELEKKNEEDLKKFEERREEAEKLEGETDVVEALRDKAMYLTRIGDKVCLYFPYAGQIYKRPRQERALEAQKVALEKTVGAGQKIDIVLTLVRIGFFFGDNDLITDNLQKAEECVSCISSST
jgi:26S proteasome regulatory subunit N7